MRRSRLIVLALLLLLLGTSDGLDMRVDLPGGMIPIAPGSIWGTSHGMIGIPDGTRGVNPRP